MQVWLPSGFTPNINIALYKFAYLLCIPRCLGIVFIVAIAVIPGKTVNRWIYLPDMVFLNFPILIKIRFIPINWVRVNFKNHKNHTALYSPGWSMGFPRAQADPAELCFAVLVPTHHVVTAAILLYGYMAFGTFLQHNNKTNETRYSHKTQQRTVKLQIIPHHWP